MPIQTNRLILRVFIPEDFEALRELDSDPEVLRYRSRKTISPEMTHEFLARARQSVGELPRRFYAYGVILRRDASLVGQCGLTVLAPAALEAFTWYSMLPRYWGQGYMSEAMRALLYAAVTEFGLQQIFAECHPDNRTPIRVMEKAGMQFEGNVQVPVPGGGTEERIRYSLYSSRVERPAGPALCIEPTL